MDIRPALYKEGCFAIAFPLVAYHMRPFPSSFGKATSRGHSSSNYNQVKAKFTRRGDDAVGVRPKMKQIHLAKKLLKIRKALDLSQNEMLKKLGLEEPFNRQSISFYERGKLEPPLFVLLRYARVAGICTDMLIDDRLKLPSKLPATPAHKP